MQVDNTERETQKRQVLCDDFPISFKKVYFLQ